LLPLNAYARKLTLSTSPSPPASLGFLVLGPAPVKVVAAKNEFGPIYIVMAILSPFARQAIWFPAARRKDPSLG